MSKTKSVVCLFLVLLLAVPAFAQQSSKAPAASRDAATTKGMVESSGGALISADRILNRNIYGANDRDIGDLERLYVDARTGRIAFVGVQTGGVLGIGGETVAVPWEAIKMDQRERISMNVSEDKLKNAPRIRTDADQINDRAFRDNLYSYYGVQPEKGILSGTTTPAGESGRLISLDRLINRNITTQAGENIGELERVYLNPQSGKAELAVISSGGVLGVGSSNMAVPWQAISLNDRGNLIMNVDQAKLRGAPPYDPNRINEPTFRQRLYDYFGYNR